MNRELYLAERRRQRARNLRALVVLAVWVGGAGLLHRLWLLRESLEPPLDDIVGTATYLVTFFYVFAFWPIASLVDRLCRPRQDAVGPARLGEDPADVIRR